MNYFTVEELLFLHYKIVEDYGGAHGVRDIGRLEAVIAAPGQEVFGQALYPTLFEKAAVYMRSIIGDHPFADGNKRSGTTLAVMFMARHDFTLTASPKELENFAVQVAVEQLDVPYIAAWLKSKSKSTK